MKEMKLVWILNSLKIRAWKRSKCSSLEEWIKNMWFMRTMEYYSAMKEKEILPFAAT